MNIGDSDSLPNSRCNSGTSDTIKPVKKGYCVKQGAVVSIQQQQVDTLKDVLPKGSN